MSQSDSAETVLACPRCDSTHITTRSARFEDLAPEADYYCDDCCEPIEQPVKRENRNTGTSLHGLAYTLDQTDPDDLPAGGGS